MVEKCWTEAELLKAARDQRQPTWNYLANIIKNESNSILSLHKQKTESTNHLMSHCQILTPREYKENMIK